jgi:plastocyanin
MGSRRTRSGTLAALSFALLWPHGGQALVLASEPEVDAEAIRADITIKARQFQPSSVSVPVGQHVVLVFHNQDAELHAFVPRTFLEHVPLHVEGNGAPQFGDSGLARVLIPSGGRAELRFVPRMKGVYRYQCDLPGHQMIGEMVVEDSLPEPGMAPEQGNIDTGRP